MVNAEWSPRKVTPSSTEPRKHFLYMPIGPRLARWFGETNLAKLVQAGALELNSEIADFKDGTDYQAWFQDGGLLAGYGDGGIPLGLFTDGMNPNKNPALQRSMWPMVVTWLSPPPEHRTTLGPMMLVGTEKKTGSYVAICGQEYRPHMFTTPGSVRFGGVTSILKHSFLDTSFTWVRVALYPLPQHDSPFWHSEDTSVETCLVESQYMSHPLTCARACDERRIYFLNSKLLVI